MRLRDGDFMESNFPQVITAGIRSNPLKLFNPALSSQFWLLILKSILKEKNFQSVNLPVCPIQWWKKVLHCVVLGAQFTKIYWFIVSCVLYRNQGFKWRREKVTRSMKCNQCKEIVWNRMRLLNIELKKWTKVNRKETQRERDEREEGKRSPHSF